MSTLRIAATIPIAKTADWVAVAPAGVWVGSTGPDAANEIDPATNRVTSIALPGRPCAGLAAAAGRLWVPLCGATPKLAEIDTASRTLVRVLDIGPAGPEGGIAVGAGSVWLVVDRAGTLARIDPSSGTIVQRIVLPAGSYNPVFASGRIWVSQVDGTVVSEVDPGAGRVVGTVAVGPHPRFLAAGGGAVWTLNQGDGTLSRVGTADRAARTVPLHTPGAGGDVAFAEGRVWTTMMKTPLTIVDAASGKPLCQWQGAGGDSLNVGHGSLWLTNLRDGTVSRIRLADLPADCRPGGG
jgi:streptogramin lyase